MSSSVKDVMSTHVTAVRPGAGYKEMAATLCEQRVSAFPVIDAENKVIGSSRRATCWPRRQSRGRSLDC